MSLRIGLVRAARLSHPHPRFSPTLFVRASHDLSLDASTSARLEGFLRRLRYPEEPNAVRRDYLPLVAELERLKAQASSPPLPQLLTRAQLLTIMDFLATSGRPLDMECIRSMFSHLPMYFNVDPTPDLHNIVIAALLKQGYVPLAVEWIKCIPRLPPYTSPTLEHFHTLMKGCPHHISLTFLREVINHRMHKAGVLPDMETFSILVRCIVRNAREFKVILKPETFSAILADIKKHQLNPDPSILPAIQDYYAENGFQLYADDIRKIYDVHFPDEVPPGEEQAYAWKNQLVAASQQSGVGHALDVFRDLTAEGCTATPEIFRAILNFSRTLGDLRQVEKALGIQASAPEYTILVTNNIWVKKVKEALAIYAETRAAGIVPVAGLVAPIIRSLCVTDSKKPAAQNVDLDKALELYSDLDDAWPAPADSPPSHDSLDLSKGPNTDIYTSLLGGLSRSPNIRIASVVANALFEDMKARGIAVTTAHNISKVVLEMCNCDTLETAFQTYRKHRADLTEYGYLAVLHAFSRMSLGMGHPDSLEHYFLIVGDMRIAGFRISEKIYIDILQQFIELAGIREKVWRKRAEEENKWYKRNATMPPTLFQDIETAVRQVHDVMSLDPSLTPERHIWGRLMQAYQRLGNFPDAYRVWEKLQFSNKFSPYAVSIILNACGRAGNYDIANGIANRLVADGYTFTLRNWNAFVESLCLTSHMSDALKVVCTTMGTSGQPVKPDLSTLAILLKYAESTIQSNIIMQRIRRFAPELWELYLQSKEAEEPPQ